MAQDPLSEVGCPHVVRGFDYDWVGVLWLRESRLRGTFQCLVISRGVATLRDTYRLGNSIRPIPELPKKRIPGPRYVPSWSG